MSTSEGRVDSMPLLGRVDVQFRHLRLSVLALAALALIWVAPALAEKPEVAPLTLKVGPDAVHLGVPPWATLTRYLYVPPDDGASWFGSWAGSRVRIELGFYERKGYGITDPRSVFEVRGRYSEPMHMGNPGFVWQLRELIQGRFGSLPFGALRAGLVPSKRNPQGELIVLAGVLETHGYQLSILAHPPLPLEQRTSVLAYLRTGLSTDARVLSPQWSEGDVRARLEEAVSSEPLRKEMMRRVVRTKHYIIFTNIKDGRALGESLEATYERVKVTFPFQEIRHTRLLPVFAFDQAGEYYDYCQRVAGWKRSHAVQSVGHAAMDYYAAHGKAPSDPVHVHEATHQLFRNRLFLGNGGIWFQEGVAEYMSTSSAQRRTFVREVVKKGDFIPFPEFFAAWPNGLAKPRPLLLGYRQAATVIEFLRDDKQLGPRFGEFIRRMGGAWCGIPRITEHILRDLYGMDPEELQAAWLRYFGAR